jgi:hypothetical protein
MVRARRCCASHAVCYVPAPAARLADRCHMRPAAQAEKDRARARGASAPGGVGGGMMSDAAERERRREPKRRRYGSAAQQCEHSPVHGRDGFSCPQTFAQFVSNAFNIQ